MSAFQMIRSRSRSIVMAGCVALVGAVGGCLSGAGGRGAGGTQTDLLRDHYEDLAGGKFAIIADFEEPSHIELFHTANGLPEDVAVVPKAGIAETGGTCLRATLHDSQDRLVADNANAENWLLKRDWRSYDLLLMNVLCPVAGLNMDLAITSGEGEGAGEAHSLIPLHEGWNLLRLDLDEASDFVALDDVRSVVWSIPGLSEPLELMFDDIVLAENRTEVYGKIDAAPGALYVYEQGRRLQVGASGRFELGFAGGQIVRWYDLQRDPLRLADLVGAGSALGPTPVVLPDDETLGLDDQAGWPEGFAALGKLVQVRQRVVEANPVRVIVESSWTFQRSAAGAEGDAPSQRWRYVIYPSGHVYATVEATVRSGTFAPTDVGLIVNRAAVGGLTFDVHEPGQLGDTSSLQHVAYAFSSMRSGQAGLLFVPYDSRQAPRLRVLRASDADCVSVVTGGGIFDAPTARWCCMFRVWRSETEDGVKPEADAVSYAEPPNVEFLVGDWKRDAPGDAGGDGFDESAGVFVLSPDGNRVQLELDGEEAPIVEPAFRIPDAGAYEAWVYVDYAIHRPVARNDAGDLLFQLPTTVTGKTVVEVYLRRR